MRTPLPTESTMLLTAAVCALLACSGAALARESNVAGGADKVVPGGWPPRRSARCAFAAAAPAVPVIAAAARLTLTGRANRRWRMCAPRGWNETDEPAEARTSVVWASARRSSVTKHLTFDTDAHHPRRRRSAG